MFATMDLTKNTQKCGASSLLLPVCRTATVVQAMHKCYVNVSKCSYNPHSLFFLFTLVNFNFVM